MQVNITNKILAGNFNYYKDGSTRPPVHQDPYVADLNGDGLDEVIFGGLETQPNTPAEFSPLTVHIFGWKNGVFQNLSDQWLPNGAGEINGSGSIVFADFNADGLNDIFLSAYADMDDIFSPHYLLNKGGFFEKFTLPKTQAWQHGSDTFDINKDGYSDVFATGYGSSPSIYLGGSEGLKSYHFTNWAGGSDVALGDFLGDGTTTAVITDYYTAGSDTMLLKVHLSEGTKSAHLEEIGLLPAALLENLNTSNKESHDVRIKAIDFNSDGLLDVALYSRLSFDGMQWPNVSAVQFLQNNGKGVFIDVTATKVQGYVSSSMIPYAPVIRDLNKDGLIDLYVDGSSWNILPNSASMLIQDSLGNFVDTARTQLSSQVETDGGISSVALGPDGNFHLITLSLQKGQGVVYSQKIGFPDRNMSESLRGTNLIDYIWGLGGDDSIQGLGGNDVIDGGDGIDTSVYAKNASSYSMNMPINGQIFVSGSDGVDQLTGIERIRFADKSIAIDVDGNAGIAAKILGAVFGKSAVSNKEYVGIGLDLLDKGMSHDTLAGLALNAAKATTNDQIVTTLWTNVVGSAPSAADKAPFIKMLEDGMTPGALAQMAADTSINTTNINLVGLSQTGIDFTSAG